MSEGDGDTEPKPKRPKINASCVHAEYQPAKMRHATTKEMIDGSVCNYCGDIVPGRAATDLKSHLKTCHRPVFDNVDSKFGNQTFLKIQDG